MTKEKITTEDLVKFGYTPGDYLSGKCSDCGVELHEVAKRSWRCKECATKEFIKERDRKAMPDREKVEKIYEVMADKTLKFGCEVEVSPHEKIGGRDFDGVLLGEGSNHAGQTYKIMTKRGVDDFLTCGYSLNTIGHPVMIGRCDMLIQKGPQYFDDWTPILDLWIKKDEPIGNQSKECIDFIHKFVIRWLKNQSTK